MKNKILISTGGSGGHVIPAKIIGEHLKDDFEVFYSTDFRGLNYSTFNKDQTLIVDTPKLNISLNFPIKFIRIIFFILKTINFLRKKKITKVKNILLKGGHSKNKSMNDVFLNNKEFKIFKNKRIKTKNTHGTGCTLSSAITTFFACGKTLNKSCELAIKYVNQSIRSNLNYGKGHGPINHLSCIKINRKFK